MSSKNNPKRIKVKNNKSIQKQIYKRSKRELHHPSTKIGKNWTRDYTDKFQLFWNKLYSDILKKEMNIDKSITSPTYQTFVEMKTNPSKFKKKRKKKRVKAKIRSRAYTTPNRTAYKQSIASHNAKNAFSAGILREMCTLLEFGVFTLQNVQNEYSRFESDIVSFWFSIQFNINHRTTQFLCFKFIKDQMTKKAKSGKVFESHKIQISCDFDYAQKNQIINDELCLPKEILIEIFKYTIPNGMLALYTYDVAFDTNPFQQKNFHTSNVQWVCNYFGLETYLIRKLFKILMTFLYSDEVDKYIEKTKTYDKNWKEWQNAQLDLNIIQIHKQMKYARKRRA